LPFSPESEAREKLVIILADKREMT